MLLSQIPLFNATIFSLHFCVCTRSHSLPSMNLTCMGVADKLLGSQSDQYLTG